MTGRGRGRLRRALALVVPALVSGLLLASGVPGAGGAATATATTKSTASSTAAKKKTAVKKKPAAKRAAGKSATKTKASRKKSTARSTRRTGRTATKSSRRSKARAPRSATRTSPIAGRSGSAKATPFALKQFSSLHHYRPASPGAEAAGTLDLGDAVARFSGWHGVMNLERGPVLTAAQGDWLAGMTAYRVVNWASYQQANAKGRGPCGDDPVRWVAVRRTPGTSPDKPVANGVDIAVLSEANVMAFRPDRPTLCLFSTYYDTDAGAASSAAAKKKPVRKKHTRTRVRRGKPAPRQSR